MRFMLQALSFSPGYDSALESELASCATVMYCLQLNMAWLKGLICSYHPVKWRWSLRWLQTQLLLYSKLPSTIQSKHTFFDVEWSTAYHFFWPRLGDNFSKTSKAQYSQCGWGCPGPFDDPAECGFGWGWGRKALFQFLSDLESFPKNDSLSACECDVMTSSQSSFYKTLCVLSLLVSACLCFQVLLCDILADLCDVHGHHVVPHLWRLPEPFDVTWSCSHLDVFLRAREAEPCDALMLRRLWNTAECQGFALIWKIQPIGILVFLSTPRVDMQHATPGCISPPNQALALLTRISYFPQTFNLQSWRMSLEADHVCQSKSKLWFQCIIFQMLFPAMLWVFNMDRKPCWNLGFLKLNVFVSFVKVVLYTDFWMLGFSMPNYSQHVIYIRE